MNQETIIKLLRDLAKSCNQMHTGNMAHRKANIENGLIHLANLIEKSKFYAQEEVKHLRSNSFNRDRAETPIADAYRR